MHYFESLGWTRGCKWAAFCLLVMGALGLAACGNSGSSTPTAAPKKNRTPFAITTLANPLGGFNFLPAGVENVPYAFGFQTNVGAAGSDTVAPVTFQLTSSSTLPPGMTLSQSGILSGSPTAAGEYFFSIVAVDSSPTPKITAPASLGMTVAPPGADLTVVGQNNLGGEGQNGAVSVQGHLAFVGTLGQGSPLSATPSASGAACPATGVKIVDLSNPNNPQLLYTLGGTGGTAQPEAKAAMVSSPDFYASGSGDLLAVAVAPCVVNNGQTTNASGGVQLYDVTNPTAPVSLGFWPVNSPGLGVHSVAIVPSADTPGHIYILAAVSGSEAESQAANEQNGSAYPTLPFTGDLRVIDATDPSHPVSAVLNGLPITWGIGAATNTAFDTLKVGADQRVFLDQIHLDTETVNGSPVTYAYLGYWDEGVAIVNVTNPLNLDQYQSISNDLIPNPSVLIAHLIYPTISAATAATATQPAVPSIPEGNTREALPILNGSALLLTDQVCTALSTQTNPSAAAVCGFSVPLTSSEGGGFFRTYSLTTPSEPILEGGITTPQTEADPPVDSGVYTAHSLAWNGDAAHPHAYVSWYSNGVLDVDVTALNTPSILADFIPPAASDPQGGNPAKNNPDAPLVDGVAAFSQNGNRYIVASDINSGLYVVQESTPPQFEITTSSLPNPNVGVHYSEQLETINAAGHINWSVNSGALPTGVQLGNSGAITGTPVTDGNYSFAIEAATTAGQTAIANYAITVTSNFAIVNASPLPIATLHESYQYDFASANGSGPVQWAVTGGALPPGMGMNSDGSLTGTPTANGTYNFTVTATDSLSPTPDQASASFAITVEPLAFSTSPALPAGGVDVGYSQSLQLANGTSPISLAVTNGSTLPPGLILTQALGQLSGTPTTAGNYSFNITATDADSQTVTQNFTLVIAPFVFNTTTLPTGTVGTGYNQQLTVQNGASPETYSLTNNTVLPPGLSLSTSGVINGIPTTAGSFSFTVVALDKDGATAQQNFTLVINPGS